MQALTWDYPLHGPQDEPDAEAVLQEINGRTADGRLRRPLPGARRTTGRRRAARGSTPASTPTGSTRPRASARTPSRTGSPRSGAGRGRPTAGSSTTAPRRGPTARRGPSASATSGGTPRQGRWASLGDDPDFEADKAPDAVPDPDDATGMAALRGDAAVHHAPRRPRLALRARRPRRRPAAHALRAARVAGRQPALRRRTPTRRASASTSEDNPYHPSGRRPGADVFPYVAHHLPAHRAPHGGRHVAHRALPVRAAARDVRRGQPRAGRRARPRARRLGDDRQRAVGDRGARDGHRPAAPADRRRAHRPPGRAALPLGPLRGWSTGDAANELLAARARPQRAHRRVQGRDLRHPARPAPARAGAARVRRRYRRRRAGILREGRHEAREA